MYKLLTIGGLVLAILYKLFGTKGFIVLLCVAAILLGLVYLNQNKILYIPRTSPNMKSYQTRPFPHQATLPDGGIQHSKAAQPKTCN
jgi:hypothetical protein